MGYRHIENLYRNQTILIFRECYALEKVHGTSAHVTLRLKDGAGLFVPATPDMVEVTFMSGGASHMQFITLFDIEDLKKRFLENGYEEMTIYGEAYGGKMQGMRETYGDQLRFIVFEIEMGGKFLGVESADFITQKMGLEFVPYRKISTDLASLDAERDLPSRVAVRRGITEPKMAEGVVLRPPIEIGYDGGKSSEFGRIIVKHKRPEFSERTSKKDTQVDPGKLEVLTKANDIATEWVTPMRLEHVMDKLKVKLGVEALAPEHTKQLIEAMIEDVTREAKDEITVSKEALKAIGNATAKLFKEFQRKRLERVAAEQLMTATPEEFGQAALTAAQKDATSDPRR